MEPQTNTGQYSIVTLTLLGVVMLILSSAIGAILGPVIFPPVAGTQAEPISIASASVGAPSQDIRVLFGTVKAIKGSNFTLHTQTYQNDPLVDRNVSVTTGTKVIKIIQKDEATMQSEMTEYERIASEAKKLQRLVLPFDMFAHSSASASEIAVGDTVTVTAEENINTKKEFTATSIELYPKVSTNVIK